MRKSENGIIIQREGALRQGLLDFIAALPDMKGMRMLEVGSYAGESAEMFAESGKFAEIVCIDPWQAGYDDADEASRSNMAEAEAAFDRVMNRWWAIRKFKGTLAEFAAKHPFMYPDLVYIDACHTYEGCKADIAEALNLEPGIIAGHDYAHWCEGVVRAVDEVLGKPQMRFQDGSWMFNLKLYPQCKKEQKP